MTSDYLDHLTHYLADRRWFAGKGREFSVVHVDALPWLAESEDERVRIEVVTVAYDDGTSDAYQVPVAYRSEPDPELVHALMGAFSHPELGDVVAYDAVYLKSAADLLLRGFLDESSRTTAQLTFTVVEAALLPEEPAPGTVLTAEQSNTSIVYGEAAILKLFRRLSEGHNPDIEVHDALTRHGAENVATLLGWLSGRWHDSSGSEHRGDLAMLQAFLRTATDGWSIAVSSVRDLLVEEDLHPEEVGADFAAEAQRLGAATAQVHADLAELFETSQLEGHELTELAAAMQARLDAAVAIVADLADVADVLGAHYDAVAALGPPLSVQRIHGDLHLGQTLRTVKGWKIIDFEGEPIKSFAERTALDSPVRDVAGMLRSFDYAAGATLWEFGPSDQLRYRSQEWSVRNRTAFLSGYDEVTGEPSAHRDVLLRAYETDKAVYEAVYETRNRPGWLTIPMNAIARIAAEE